MFFDPQFVVNGRISCDYLPCDCCFWRQTNYISSNSSHFTWNGVQFGLREANFEFIPVFGVDSTNNAYASGAPRPLYAKQGDSLYTNQSIWLVGIRSLNGSDSAYMSSFAGDDAITQLFSEFKTTLSCQIVISQMGCRTENGLIYKQKFGSTEAVPNLSSCNLAGLKSFHDQVAADVKQKMSDQGYVKMQAISNCDLVRIWCRNDYDGVLRMSVTQTLKNVYVFDKTVRSGDRFSFGVSYNCIDNIRLQCATYPMIVQS